MAKLPKQPIKGLIDGITVLQAVAVRREPSSVTALSEELGLEKTRVHRILGTLAHLGILHRTDKGLYDAGSGMHVLAAQSMFSSGLVQSALPRLEELGATGLTVGFGVLWRDKVSFLYHQTPGLTPLESLGRIGLYEATRSSVGLALLAATKTEAVKSLYAKRIPAGFTSVTELLKELKTTWERGYALICEKGGHMSLAVTLGSPAYAGIALAGTIPKKNLPGKIRLLQSAANRIEKGKP